MALLRAGALQLQSGSNAIRPAEESWHGTVCRAGRLAGADLGLCCRRRRQGDLGRQVHLHPGGDCGDHPHEGARGGAHRSGERPFVGLALARAAEARPAGGLSRRSARQGGARPAAEQVRPQRCSRPGADRTHRLVPRGGSQERGQLPGPLPAHHPRAAGAHARRPRQPDPRCSQALRPNRRQGGVGGLSPSGCERWSRAGHCRR